MTAPTGPPSVARLNVPPPFGTFHAAGAYPQFTSARAESAEPSAPPTTAAPITIRPSIDAMPPRFRRPEGGRAEGSFATRDPTPWTAEITLGTGENEPRRA